MSEFKSSGEFATTWVGGLGLIQGEEIVRCRDCKHYTDDEFEYRHYCNEWCGQVEPDDFCAWALERK